MIDIHKKTCTLFDLSVGDVFIYNDELFMRIDPIKVSDMKSYNVVSLESGLANEMSLCKTVWLCKLTIECATN